MAYLYNTLPVSQKGSTNGICPLDSSAKISYIYERHNTKLMSMTVVPYNEDVTVGARTMVLLPTYFTMSIKEVQVRVITVGDTTGTTEVDILLDGATLLTDVISIYANNIGGTISFISDEIQTSNVGPVFLEVVVEAAHTITPPKGLVVMIYFEDRSP